MWYDLYNSSNTRTRLCMLNPHIESQLHLMFSNATCDPLSAIANTLEEDNEKGSFCGSGKVRNATNFLSRPALKKELEGPWKVLVFSSNGNY